MKIGRTLSMMILSMALLGWVAACAGTNGMMDKKMDSSMDKKMDNSMDKKMDGSMDKKMDNSMDKTMAGSMDKKMDNSMDKTMDSGMSGKMETAMDTVLMGSGGHHAAGKVALGMGMSNNYKLTLSDIKVDKVPDGYVYLTRNGDRMHGVELGTLKQFSGTVSYELPANVNPDDYDTLVIWCKKFKVEIGRAKLPHKAM